MLLRTVDIMSCICSNVCVLYPEMVAVLQPPKASPRRQDSGSSSSRKASRSFSGLMSDVPACINFMDPKDSYPPEFESEYGPNHPSRELVRTARRVVVKVKSPVNRMSHALRHTLVPLVLQLSGAAWHEACSCFCTSVFG